jgi:osmotically-inducible protein OsmY
MKSDTQIRDDVIEELRWDPQITEPDANGVAVTDGAVTLTGGVATYAEKLASWTPTLGSLAQYLLMNRTG